MRWREHSLKSGLQGIARHFPRGVPAVKVDVAKLVEVTAQSLPETATHWSTRKIGEVLGVSASTIMRHWQARHLEAAHRARPQVVARPEFVEKLENIVGLYMSPPEHALDCTQPGLPMKKGVRPL